MLKQLALTKEDLATVEKTLIEFENCMSYSIHDERNESLRRNCLHALLDYGFVLESSKTIDCDGVNYSAQIKISLREGTRFIDEKDAFYFSGKPHEGNEYCPDGSRRIEGYTHKITLNGYDLHVLKWREGGILIFLDVKCKIKTFTFKHPFFGTTAYLTLWKYGGRINLMDYNIFTEVSRDILRDREHIFNIHSRINDAEKKIEAWAGNCKPTKRCEEFGQSASLIAYIKNYFDNLANGFAARYFDTVKQHGITSKDAEREYEIAVKALAFADRDISDETEEENLRLSHTLLDECDKAL